MILWYIRCGVLLRYEVSTFFSETTSFNAVSCGNRTAESTEFTSAAQKLLTNLRTTIPTASGFYAASKTQMPNNGPTIYAFAQCIETITQSACLDCLTAGDNNMQTCLPNSDGRAYAAGCFIRYSTSSFFPDNQTIDAIPLVIQGSSSNKRETIGKVVGGVALSLILLALFAWIKQRKSNKKVPRGNHLKSDLTGVSKLKGPVTYSYNDLVPATKNFSEENKLGEGGSGAVYKAWNLYEKGRHLELVDKTANPNGYDAEEVKRIIEIGLLCTQASADTRPMMSEVVALLQNKDLLDNISPTMPILIETN
ncbi:cysteine-rich receptor-like protein kinase 3 [Neltuma alba]|uniref:cysteine-rich receptor-like protein kinase 3 n=1 Tax=Neltuma alba TaxID=207710 RepID=UPI0010A30D5D|nr:cysteine-rich receptor-like protein kinase 3 [Prosopis alba]